MYITEKKKNMLTSNNSNSTWFMKNFWNKHVFTAELPYEKDQVVTLFLRDRFSRVDSFVMSLGQMIHIPPSKLYSYVDGNLIEQRIFKRNKLQGRGKILSYFFIIPTALIKVTFDFFAGIKINTF